MKVKNTILSAICFFSLIVTIVSLRAESLQTASSLSTGSGLSTGSADPAKLIPVPGSQIVSTAYPIEGSSATEFLAKKFVALEKAVEGYEAAPPSGLKARNEEIRKIVSSTLDLDRLANRALISYWKEIEANPELKKMLPKYVKLFKEVVEENYLEKARDYLNKKYQIPLVKEEVNAKFISVTGRIKKPDVDLILEFRILKENEAYQVADVKLDETSLEGTYRSSFNRIIRKKDGVQNGFPELLRVMEKRLQELRAGDATRL